MSFLGAPAKSMKDALSAYIAVQGDMIAYRFFKYGNQSIAVVCPGIESGAIDFAHGLLRHAVPVELALITSPIWPNPSETFPGDLYAGIKSAPAILLSENRRVTRIPPLADDDMLHLQTGISEMKLNVAGEWDEVALMNLISNSEMSSKSVLP